LNRFNVREDWLGMLASVGRSGFVGARGPRLAHTVFGREESEQ
jgi:hypothetical protein